MLKVLFTQLVRQESAMPIATVAIDLAKTVFELAAAVALHVNLDKMPELRKETFTA
jgi:hypothetical protein